MEETKYFALSKDSIFISDTLVGDTSLGGISTSLRNGTGQDVISPSTHL